MLESSRLQFYNKFLALYAELARLPCQGDIVKCDMASEWHGRFMTNLHSSGLHMISAEADTTSISALIRKAQVFRLPADGLDTRAGRCRSMHITPLTTQDYRARLDGVIGLLKAVCLDCVRESSPGEDGGQCRLPHAE